MARLTALSSVSVSAIFCGLAFLSAEAKAAPFVFERILTNPSPSSQDRFGSSVTISGDTLIAGAVFNDRLFTDDGIAYRYDLPTGTRTQNIFNPRPSTGDHFGVSADSDGNLAVIGSHFDDVGGVLRAGRAYLYDTSTGARLRTFNNPEASLNDFFGDSAAISGTSVLIGGRNLDTGPGNNIGGAYLFDALNGSLLQTFNNPNPSSGDQFGFHLDIDGDVAAISAVGEDTGAGNAGAVYLFDTVSGALSHSLFNPNPGTSGSFGASLNVFKDRVLVGLPGDDSSAVDSGSAYLYDTTTGGILHTFSNPTAEIGDTFGGHVAMNDDYIVITAGSDNTAGSNAGAAYVYDAMTFNLLQTIVNPNPADTFFGGGSGDSKIALGADWLAISNANGNDSGSIAVYRATGNNGVPSGGAFPLLMAGLLSFGAYRRTAA